MKYAIGSEFKINKSPASVTIPVKIVELDKNESFNNTNLLELIGQRIFDNTKSYTDKVDIDGHNLIRVIISFTYNDQKKDITFINFRNS